MNKTPSRNYAAISCLALGLIGLVYSVTHQRVMWGVINLVAYWLFAAFLVFVVPHIRK